MGPSFRKVLAITYHDVVENGNFDGSGFPGFHSRRYKLEVSEFARHLDAIRRARSAGAVEDSQYNARLLLTFDDGGVSAIDHIAPLLERNGWRGYFFVTTNWIGRPGFLNAGQVRELDKCGHMIGSHSCSHPSRISQISRDHLLIEWSGSIQRLEEIVGHRVTAASVPGGYYSQKVAETAAEVGIETLFTSEPTATVRVVQKCCVLGRYTIQRWMGPEWSGGLAAGQWAPRFRQSVSWKSKQIAKSIGGNLYLHAQEKLFSICGEYFSR